MKLPLRRITSQTPYKGGSFVNLECGHSKHIKGATFGEESIKEKRVFASCKRCVQ